MEDFMKGIDNKTVLDSLLKARAVLARHKTIVVSTSGGSDSDIVMDIIEKTKGDKQVKYVWFNTGLEYQATKDHLNYLEDRYGIKIERLRPKKSIPTCVRERGVPFLSKYVSECLASLQRHDFKFEDKPAEELQKEYNLKTYINWWCDISLGIKQYCISYNKYLKEFMLENPLDFKVDNACCYYAKKKLAHDVIKETGADLQVLGVRKAEGGIRSVGYKSCYEMSEKTGAMQFRPIFWYNDEDKKYYEERFGIVHSECYTKYGLLRTGCVGCPYDRNVIKTLEVVKQYEPNLYKACMNVFGKSYEYTRKYREFCEKKKWQESQDDCQLTLDDIFYDYTDEDESPEQAV